MYIQAYLWRVPGATDFQRMVIFKGSVATGIERQPRSLELYSCSTLAQSLTRRRGRVVGAMPLSFAKTRFI
jgi:hypothetical protein